VATGQVATVSATVEADNAYARGNYRLTEVTSIVSLNRQPLRLTNFRSIQLQRNQSADVYEWGPLEAVASCALESRPTDRYNEFVIPPPSVDGTLAPGRINAYRIFFLADVAPAQGGDAEP
jgi:hypothetical protein